MAINREELSLDIASLSEDSNLIRQIRQSREDHEQVDKSIDDYTELHLSAEFF